MYTLRVRNFQSIAKQNFELSGFVAITGPSNLGKSAIRRAFQSVAYNDWDPTYQRLGSEKCQVEFAKPEDELSILMTKSEENGDNQYILKTHIGEQKFNKVGRGIPDEISDLGFGLLSIGDEDFNLQVSTQLEKLFMVTYNTPTKTKILNKIFNVSKLESAAGSAISDQRKIKQEANRKVTEYNTKKTHLDAVTIEHDELEAKYTRAKTLYDATTLLSEYEEINTGYTDTLIELNGIQSSMEAKQSILDKMEAVKLVFSFVEDVDELDTLTFEQESTDRSIQLKTQALSLLESIVLINEFNTTSVVLESASDSHKSILDNISVCDLMLTSAESALTISEFISSQEELDAVTIEGGCLVTDHNNLSITLQSAELASIISEFLSAQSDLDKVDEETKHLSRNDDFINNFDSNRDLINYIFRCEKLVHLDSEIEGIEKSESMFVSVIGRYDNVARLSTYFDTLEELEVLTAKEVTLTGMIDKLNKEMDDMPKCKECGSLLSAEHLEKTHA